MTYQDHCTLPTELLEQISQQGLDFLPEIIIRSLTLFLPIITIPFSFLVDHL